MAVFRYDDPDTDILQDFAQDSKELSAAAESNLLSLEQTPEDAELLNALFRSIHTIKGNSGLLGIEPLVVLLQALESILDSLRQGSLVFQPLLGDLTLLTLDRCNDFLSELTQHYEAAYDRDLFLAVATQLEQSLEVSGREQNAILTNVLTLLDPQTSQLDFASQETDIFSDLNLAPSDDLRFIYQLATQTQHRADFWQDRLKRVLTWVTTFNEYAGHIIETEQLFVAVCVHDIAMAMLPSEVINKSGALTEEELEAIRNHVLVASRLTSSFPRWQGARKILEQHQENFDGSGYPLGLSGGNICTGAQMLSIVHAFEAITHGYSKELSRKRPLMRAVMELNRFSGVQFNPKWVQIFMEVTRADSG